MEGWTMTTEMVRAGSVGLAIYEPKNFQELKDLAAMAAGSRLFAITSPDAAAVVMLTGASLGLPPIAAMRGIHVVSGKPVLSSDLLVAVVRRSGLCDVWEPVEVTNAACTIRTHRRGDPSPVTHTWTIDDAKRAGLAGKGNWNTYPRAMLRARCSAELARMVYPDVLFGVYVEGELGEEHAVEVEAPSVVVETHPVASTRRPTYPAPVASSPTMPVPAADPMRAALADVSSEQPASLRSLAATVDAEPAADDATRAAGERATLRLALLEQVSRCKTPGAVADLWVASKTERDTLTEDDVKVVWKASVNRVKEHQRSTDAGAKSWLKKAVAERTPPDDGTNGPTKPRNGRSADATGNGAANDSARADGAVACVRDPVWSQSADELRRHLSTKTCVTMLRNSLAAHAAELTADACALYAQRYADLWAAMPDHLGGTLHPRSARAWVDGVLAQAARGERRAA
jgi:hypothetical protein